MFDPLHKWLGIPPDEQPPNHYRLLGITVFESDPDVIDAAADKQLAFLHDLTNGEQAEQAEELSNQVSAARICLLHPEKKSAYDATLRTHLAGGGTQATDPSTPDPLAVRPAADVPRAVVAEPVPQVRVRKRRRARTRSSSRRFWQLSGLLCLVALGLIGIGLMQGRIVIRPLNSLGLGPSAARDAGTQTGQPNDAASAPSTTPAPPPASTGETAATGPTPTDARRTEPSVPKPETVPAEGPRPPASVTAATPPPPRPGRRSLGDLLHSSRNAQESEPTTRQPLPSESDVEKKMELIRELYEGEYRAAKSSQQKIDLAQRMHREGQSTSDDAIGRFALWRVARDILTREGQFTSALAIVDNLESHYSDLDGCLLKVETIRDAAQRVPDDRVDEFADAIASVAAECIDQEEFDLARLLWALVKRADVYARLDEPQRAEMENIQLQTQAIESAFGKFMEARRRLQESPEDPQANADVGRYLCFVRSDWGEGLSYLSRTSDPAIRDVAQKESSGPSDPTQSISVADGWFDVAQAQAELIEQRNIYRHALEWYQRALDGGTGLERRKVEARIASLQKLIPTTTVLLDEDSEQQPDDVIGYRFLTSSQSRRDFARRKGNEFQLGMGASLDGIGEAMAGIELQGVDKVTVEGSASHDDMPEVDAYSKVGFVVDYHTPGGYSKRIFLGLGLRPGRQFSEAPPWGTGEPPEVTTDIGRALSYEIDLTRWAPSTWDGRCWFTIYMQNAGPSRSLSATVAWSRSGRLSLEPR